MSIISKVSERIHYYLDNMQATRLVVKIEAFKFDENDLSMSVIYRIGRQKVLLKMELLKFEKEFFDKVSAYDQHLLTKFSTLVHILSDFFTKNHENSQRFVSFIKEEIKNEQLF